MAAREKQLQRREIALARLQEALDVGKRAKTDPESLPRFLAHMERVGIIYESFEESHFAIALTATDEAAKAKENVIRQTADDLYYELIALHKSFLKPSKEEGASGGARQGSMKLPKINLPTFNGDFKVWPTYFALFETLIHKNESLGSLEKFHYLVSSLTGEPRNLLKAIPLTDGSYEEAYRMLTSRYQNRRKLAFFYWEELQGYRLKGGTARDLRKLLDTFAENVSLLRGLGLATDQWDFVLFHCLLTKLDPVVRQKFEQAYCREDIPAYHVLLEFLQGYCQSLELSGLTLESGQGKKTRGESTKAFLGDVKDSEPTTRGQCKACEASHPLVDCKQFLEMTVADRSRLVYRFRLCINCLKKGHRAASCKERGCSMCNRKHHVLLHFQRTQTAAETSTPLMAMTKMTASKGSVILATAIVEVRDRWGRFQTLRALLDCGSQASFLTKQGCNRLGLTPAQSRFSVCGLGVGPSVVISAVRCVVRSRFRDDRQLEVEALVLPQICGKLPAQHLEVSSWEFVKGLPLADPCFARSSAIDMLLGAEVFSQVVTGRKRTGPAGQPIALETWFGWCVMGGQPGGEQAIVAMPAVLDCQLDEWVRRFWELDGLSTREEEKALVEEKYRDTVYRLPNGRFCVSLPFIRVVPQFENSRAIAVKRLLSLERKLGKDPELARAYTEFMREYLVAGHMVRLRAQEVVPGEGYYIPHHPVVRPDRLTTKLRVVFDASTKAANGISLNEVLAVGPKLQLRIVAVLLRFRMQAVGFIADIKKMYRQILLRPEDWKYQRIVWREKAGQPILDFQLTTVTYGLTSSPFLAIRTIQELAAAGEQRYPEAAKILRNDVYMDDAVTGAASISKALRAKRELENLLREGGFELHKWACNRSELWEHQEQIEAKDVSLDQELPHSVKVLGLKWRTENDVFSYEVTQVEGVLTKRKLLSNLARIFDPLGLIGPVTFMLKVLFRTLWLTGLSWDEETPSEIARGWVNWQESLPELQTLRLPRFVGVADALGNIQLHGFCDASERGYAAVVYVRVEGETENVGTHLLIAKTRVAPLKRKSIPRLELCAAVLLAELLAYVLKEGSQWLRNVRPVAWSDSTTVLYWIKSQSIRYKPFVGNRIGLIQEALPPGTFRYVPSVDNPADIASRGALPGELLKHSLWWQGPDWLRLDQECWPRDMTNVESTEAALEYKGTVCLVGVVGEVQEWIERYSSLQKLQRVMAWVLRFKVNCLTRSSGEPRVQGPLSCIELQKALEVLIRQLQRAVFKNELRLLSVGKKLPKSLQGLNLFLDSSGLIRVGGRLEYADRTYATKYPMLLPRAHRLTELIIQNCHVSYLHPGLQTVHYLLRQRFWILSPRRAIRGVLSKCVRCFRASPRPLQPQMGNLPPSRVLEAKAFATVGVDFGGPFLVRPVKGRGRKSFRMFVCIFVCHATKAIHLEVVFDLTAEAFLAALRRFVARRGLCGVLNCDNGTNLVGARRKLEALMKEASEHEGIQFKFNPPRAPHFGGLFEAGIKSVKTHLQRAMGKQVLTLEEFLTFLAQVEALLNSRPLWGVSMDPNDLEVLTPGHFLTLAPLTALADPDLRDRPPNALSRWQLVQQLQQSFWTRWQREYLTTLQARQKWTVAGPSLEKGALVLIKDDQLKPLLWDLGRVLELYPGQDGIVRVALVKTEKAFLSVRWCVFALFPFRPPAFPELGKEVAFRWPGCRRLKSLKI